MNRYHQEATGSAVPRPVMRRPGVIPIVISPLENQVTSTGYGVTLNDGSNEEAVEHSGMTQFRIQNVHHVTGSRVPVARLSPDGINDGPEETDACNSMAQFRLSNVHQTCGSQMTSSIGRTVAGGNNVRNEEANAYDRMSEFRLPNVHQVNRLPQQSSLQFDDYAIANSSSCSKTSANIDARPIFANSCNVGNYRTNNNQNIYSKSAVEARAIQSTCESYAENIQVSNERLNEEIDTKPSVVQADDGSVPAPIQTTVQDVSTEPMSKFPSLNFRHSDPNAAVVGTIVQNSPSSYASDVGPFRQTATAYRTPDTLSQTRRLISLPNSSQNTSDGNWNSPSQRSLDGRNAFGGSVQGEKTDHSQAIRIEQIYQLADLNSAQLIMLDPNEIQNSQILGPANLNSQQQQQQQQQQQEEPAHLSCPRIVNILQSDQVKLSGYQNPHEQRLSGCGPTSSSVGTQPIQQKASVASQNILPSGSLEGLVVDGAVAGQFQDQFSETTPDAFGNFVRNRSLMSRHMPEGDELSVQRNSVQRNSVQRNSVQLLDSSNVQLYNDNVSSSLPSQGVQSLHSTLVSRMSVQVPSSSQTSQFQASATGTVDAHYQSRQETGTLKSGLAPVPATSVGNFFPQQTPIQERPIPSNQFDNSSIGNSSNLQLSEREMFLMNLFLQLCNSNSEIGNANAQAIGSLLSHIPGLGTGGLLPPSIVQSPAFIQLILHLLPLILRPGPQAPMNTLSLLSNMLQSGINPLNIADPSLANPFQNPMTLFLPSIMSLLGLNSTPAPRVESHPSHETLQLLLMCASVLNAAQSTTTAPEQQRPSQPAAASSAQLFEQLFRGSSVGKTAPAPPQPPLNMFELFCQTQIAASTNNGSGRAASGTEPSDLASAPVSDSKVGLAGDSGTPASLSKVKSCYVSMDRLPTGNKTPQRKTNFTECMMEGSKSSRASPAKSLRKTKTGNKQTGSLNQTKGPGPLHGGCTGKRSHYEGQYSDEDSEERDSAPGVYIDVALDRNFTDHQPHCGKSDRPTEILQLLQARSDHREPGGVRQRTTEFKNTRPGEAGKRGRKGTTGHKRTLETVESDNSSKKMKVLKAPGKALPASGKSRIVDSNFQKNQKAVSGRGGKRGLNPRSSRGCFVPKVSANVGESEHMSGSGRGGRGRGRGGSRGRGKCISRGRGRGRGSVGRAGGKSGFISCQNVEEVVVSKRIVVESCDTDKNSDLPYDDKSSSDNSDYMELSSSGSDEDYVATKRSRKSKQKMKFRGSGGQGRGQLFHSGAVETHKNTSDRSPKGVQFKEESSTSSVESDTTSMSHSRAAPNSNKSTGERSSESDVRPGRGRPSLFSLFPSLPSKERKEKKEENDRVSTRDPEMPALVRETTHREVARVAPIAAANRMDHLVKDRLQNIALVNNVNNRMNFSIQMIYCQLIESLQTMNVLLGLKTDSHLSFQCAFCPFTDAVIKSVSVHVCNEHSDFMFATSKAPMPSGDVLYLCCRHCDFISHDKLSMWIHFEVYHGIPDVLLGSSVTQVNPPPSRRVVLKIDTPSLVSTFFQCFDCGFLVAEDRHMVEHIVKDHGESSPNYQGCFCKARVVNPPKSIPAGVTYKELLMSKYAEFQNDVFVCIQCSYRAYTPLLAITHHIFSHLKMQMVFVCNADNCENRENDQVSFIRHFKSHHLSETDVKMQCSVTVIGASDDLASLKECTFDNRKGAVLCFSTKRTASHKMYESSDHK